MIIDILNELKEYAVLENKIRKIIEFKKDMDSINIQSTEIDANSLVGRYFNTYNDAKEFLESYALTKGIIYKNGKTSENIESYGELSITFDGKNKVLVQYQSMPVKDARVWMTIYDKRMHLVKFESNNNGEYISKDVPEYKNAILYVRWENQGKVMHGAKKLKYGEPIEGKQKEMETQKETKTITPVNQEDITSVKSMAEESDILSVDTTLGTLFNKDKRDYVKQIFKEIGKSDDNFITVNNSDSLVNINKTTNKLKQIAIPQYLNKYDPSKIKEDLKKISGYEYISDNDLKIIANSIQKKLQKESDGIIGKEKLECIMELLRESDFGILFLDKVRNELTNRFNINQDYANQTINAIRSFKEYDEVIVCKSDYILSKWKVEKFISKKRQEGISNKDICKSYSDYLDFIPPELIKILKNNGIECNR